MSDRPPRSVVLGTAAVALLLLVAAPSPAEAVRALRGAADPGDPYAPLVALLSLLAWGLAGWLALTVVVTAAGHLKGVAGRASAAVSRRIAPAAVRRGVEVALGLSVAVGTLGASPALAAHGPAAPPPAATLDGAAPAPAGAPALDWTAPAEQPDATAPALDRAAPAAAEPEQLPAGTGAVVVQPGDTLWDLAEQDLRERGHASPTDAQVAQAWPSWWAANRDAVGDDPDLIQPGTHLAPPDGPPPTS